MLAGHYEIPLVLVSVLVAVLASYTALTLASRVAHAGERRARWWIAGGAFAMGTGIWAMHFVGMLAFRLPIPLGYDLPLTLLSWLLPVMVSGLALSQLGRAELSWPRLALSALLMGAGINLMHYVGMAALRMQPGIVWHMPLVAASVAIAVAASGASLWIAAQLRDHRSHRAWLLRAGAAVAMGLAIVGMHYTGMAAARFPAGSVCLAASGQFTLTQLAVLVIVATAGVLGIALLVSVYDARLESRSQVLAIAEQTSRERQQLLERERQARADAERLSAMKDEFLATLSHELRTPLNAILGWTQLLHVKKDEASLQKGLRIIERNARLQAQLIDDLLDMSRIVSGKVRIHRELMDPGVVVEAAVEAARPAALAKQVELDANLAAAGARLWADASRLQQILWNLISNAVKFTPSGGRIGVDLVHSQGWIEVRVTDTGEGIGADFLPHVFDRFRQADASTTRRHGGLGLGLAIVRQLALLHGGTVEASSGGPGLGASFLLRLPAANTMPAADAPVPSMASQGALHGTNLRGLSILVVDDEADARLMLQQLLEQCGASVFLAGDAQEALQRLEVDRPDMMISDIGMPLVDGYELVRRLRTHPDPELARLPALALTAFTRAEDRQLAQRAGFDAHLRKPVEAGELIAQVLAAVRPRDLKDAQEA